MSLYRSPAKKFQESLKYYIKSELWFLLNILFTKIGLGWFLQGFLHNLRLHGVIIFTIEVFRLQSIFFTIDKRYFSPTWHFIFFSSHTQISFHNYILTKHTSHFNLRNKVFGSTWAILQHILYSVPWLISESSQITYKLGRYCQYISSNRSTLLFFERSQHTFG